MKDALIVGTLCAIAVAAGGWMFVYGSPFASSEAPVMGPVEFSLLAEGVDASLIEKPVNYRIVDAAGFTGLWEILGRTDELPEVNFKQSEVLAVFAGEQTTGGHAVAIAEVANTEDTRIVSIRHTVPGEGCMVSQALTYPYVFVKVPKTTLSLTHVRETIETPCE